jgi:hypothetical protein
MLLKLEQQQSWGRVFIPCGRFLNEIVFALSRIQKGDADSLPVIRTTCSK